jgi:hypothetical protein
MVGARQDDVGAVFRGNGGNFGRVGGDDAVVGDASFADALPDAEDQREAPEEAEGFPREAGRPQPSRDDGERPHFVAPQCALPVTTVTFEKCSRSPNL